MFMLGDHVLVFSLCCGGRVAGEARLQLPMTRHMWLGWAAAGTGRVNMPSVGTRSNAASNT